MYSIDDLFYDHFFIIPRAVRFTDPSLPFETDCSVCSDGYTEGLGFECDRCSSTSAGVVLAVVVFLAAAIAVVMLVRYLMSGDALRTRRGFVGKLVRFIPFQSVKIILVAWQILTQVRREKTKLNISTQSFSFPPSSRQSSSGYRCPKWNVHACDASARLS